LKLVQDFIKHCTYSWKGVAKPFSWIICK